MAAALGSPAGVSNFLSILSCHTASDVTVVCRAAPKLGAAGAADAHVREVKFHCHRSVLRSRCALLAGGEGASPDVEMPPCKRRRTVLDLDADDDVVYEVLRYMYCGTVHFHRGFHARFRQLLAVADYLGVEGGTSAAPCSALLEEPGVQHWLSALPVAELLDLLRARPLGKWQLGFNSRLALMVRLAGLRPREFSVEALASLGDSLDGLLEVHPWLVQLTVVNLAGDLVAEWKVDWATTAAELAARLRDAAPMPGARPSLVLGGRQLLPGSSLRDAGARGGGCALSLGLVWQQGRQCRCGVPAVRLVVPENAEGLRKGRAFYRCPGQPGSQCSYFEWEDYQAPTAPAAAGAAVAVAAMADAGPRIASPLHSVRLFMAAAGAA